jgi:hypothetical protein
MRATGTLFLSRTRPGVQRAADGTFALQLYAVDRIGAHQVEPWVVLWAGEEADAFWAAHRGHLVPGAALSVEVQLIQPQRAAHDHHQPAQAAA